MSLSRLVKHAQKEKIIVCVAKILDDERLLTIPKMTVVALKFTEVARKRILAAGGQCLTLDQLALKAPVLTPLC